MASAHCFEYDRFDGCTSLGTVRRYDAPAALAAALLEHDAATWAPFMGSFGNLDTNGFAESEPCDNTFASHEDYDEYTFSRVDNLQLDASFVDTFGDEIEGFVDYSNVALRNMEMSNFHTVCSIKL